MGPGMSTEESLSASSKEQEKLSVRCETATGSHPPLFNLDVYKRQVLFDLDLNDASATIGKA